MSFYFTVYGTHCLSIEWILLQCWVFFFIRCSGDWIIRVIYRWNLHCTPKWHFWWLSNTVSCIQEVPWLSLLTACTSSQ